LDLAALRARNFRRILLIKMSAMGDVIHSLPVLHKLRRRYPAARIDWLLRPEFAELVRGHPAISNILTLARDDEAPWRLSELASGLRLAPTLRAAGYDLVIDLQGQLRTALLARSTGSPVRIGFDRPRPEVWAASARTLPDEARRHAWQGAREGAWLAYTHRIPIPTLDAHAVDRYLRLGALLGLDDAPPDFSFPIPAEAEARIDALLRERGAASSRLMLMAPGTVWETKHWRSEGFAAVARHFLRREFAVVLTGSGRERAVCAEVAAAAPGTIDLSGATTLSELAAMIRRAALYVTNDSGPMHLAVALARPVVSVFGPTDPLWVGPYRRNDAVLQADLPCVPCYLRRLSRCRFGHACMREISAEAVIGRVESLLAGAAAPA
jgi:lipopolysaccharide heptosyltransferase I